jgi:hypothetical protein
MAAVQQTTTVVRVALLLAPSDDVLGHKSWPAMSGQNKIPPFFSGGICFSICRRIRASQSSVKSRRPKTKNKKKVADVLL